MTIRFPWDRSGITDDKSSDWVRCVNMAMGGTMLLPRVDWEVPVMYYDGDPDRPLVLGRLYNATGVVPYGLPGAAATTSLQSATSPSDGTTQEIRTMDDGGSMEMFVHATRDQTVFVGNDCNTDVAVDETHDVTLNFDLTVDGSQTCDVGSNQTINVGTKTDIKVAGTRSETVGALEHTEVSANREITSEGMYSEVVGGIYAMQCNQYNIDVKGAYTQTIVGTLAHAAALGTGEVVLGGRAESVGGTMNLVASSEYGEEVKMVKKVTAGAHSIKAGGKIMTESQGGDLEIDVGGSAKIKAGKDVVFKASQIVIKAPKIKAEALKMGSSKLESKKKAKIDGTIKRKGGTKIDK